MFTKALVIALTVAGTTAAVAQPRWEDRRDERRYDRRDIIENHVDHDRVMLVERARMEGQGNVKFELGGTRVRALELEAVRGVAHVRRVGLQYRDGSHAQLRVDQTMDLGKSVRIELGRAGMRGVDSIVVWGDGDAAFRIVGVR